MHIQMIGIDFQRADIAQREPVSFTRHQVLKLLPILRGGTHVLACALLATCNRTELYLHTAQPIDGLQLLADTAGFPAEQYRALAAERQGEQAVRHIMAVAAGLQSQIFGDDQIVTQVRTALDLANQAETLDSVLATLLRRAVTAGKKVKTETRLSGVPSSAASRGVERACAFFGDLEGKRAVVIGNGEMGRLTAAMLHQAGCDVTITLRSYRHGETIVPAGCHTHPYGDRCALAEGKDMLFSATASPHFTLTAAQIRAMREPPRLLVDLAMPRDIDGKAAQDTRVTVWNLDDLGQMDDENAAERAHAMQILQQEYAAFQAWYAYRQALPVMEQLKELAAERVHYDKQYHDLCADGDWDGMIQMAVGKTIDMLFGGMKEIVSPELLESCLQHMQKGSGK